MISKYLALALAGGSLIAGGQALGQGHGGGHGGGGGPPSGSNAGGMGHGGMGGMGGNAGMNRGFDMPRTEPSHGEVRRNEARVNSQGPAHASDRALLRSNENSVLHRPVPTPHADLSALRTGLVVRNPAGTRIGTVRSVVRSPDGTVRNVIVTGADGMRHTIRVAPGTLSIAGDVVTTTRAFPPHGD